MRSHQDIQDDPHNYFENSEHYMEGEATSATVRSTRTVIAFQEVEYAETNEAKCYI
jgi:hypothetical protein